VTFGGSSEIVFAKLRAAGLWLTDLCVAPELRADAQVVRRLRTAAGCSYVSLPFSAVFAVFGRKTFGGEFGDLLFALYLGSMPVVLFTLLLFRLLGRAGPIVLSCIYYFMVYCTSAYHLGGPTASTLFWIMAAPTIALFSLGRRHALFWTGMGLAAYALFLVAQQNGYAFPLEGTPTQRSRLWFSSSSALVLFMLLTVLTFERARRMAVSTLETANEALAEARDAAEEASRSKTAFLANMSHEIRTPMTAVLGFTELVADRVPAGSLLPEERSALETIQGNGHHLIKIVNELLDLSKIESGRLEIQPSRCVLVELVSEIASLLRGQATAKGSQLVVEYVGAVPEVLEIDPLRLQQVLINLVNNAIKFSFEGSVRVRVQGIPNAEMDRVRFDVIDSGIGMTRGQLATIFEPFRQADAASSRPHAGTGLGLSISLVLVKLMGGTLQVESEPGVGSTFRVELPVGTRERGRMLDSTEAVQGTTRASATRVPGLCCSVLFVDDNPDNRRLIAYFLRDAGADVHTVDSGAQALKTWHTLAPDLILMDIQMPHMDGYATTRALRERGCQVPIVALTAHAMATERERCLASGFDGYGTKPIDRRRLVDLVYQHVRAGRAPRSADESAALAPAAPARRRLGWWDGLAARLLPLEQREERAALDRARSVLWIALAAVSIMPFEALMVWLTMAPEVAPWAAGLALLVLPTALCALGLFRATGSKAVAANSMLAYCCSAIAAVTYWSGGPTAPTAFWFVLVPMVAVSLVGRGYGLAWALVAIASNALLLIAQRTGHVFAHAIPPQLAAIHSSISLAGLLCGVMLLELAFERARSDALETLAALNRSLADARQQAERANQTKSSFLANVSHELRTPMTAILGYANVLLRNWASRAGLEEARALITTVRASSERLLALINDLLDLSNVESGRLAVERIAFSPASVLHEIVTALRETAQAKGLALELELASPLPEMALGDPVRLHQIVLKLVDNAIKFTERGRVCVRAESSDAELVIAVSDTGPGIPASELPSLFGSFYQVDASAAREHGGTGLGLALCQRLIVALGGAIDVDSEVGRGTTFRVVLPARLTLPGAQTTAPTSAPNEALAALVLLAEGAPDSQHLIASLLRLSGAEVDIAANGPLALEKVRSAAAADRPYDALVLDMQLPVLDGAATIRTLRAEGHTFPILALTADANPRERERCLAAGCNDCTGRPVDRARLVAALQRLLRDKPS